MNLCQYKECTGCTACSAICPVKAISIICDERGFARPLINEKKCIQCGQCEKLVINLQNHMKTQVYMKKPVECFAVKLKNEKNRMSSQSGGAFYGIAKLFLSNKGIVYGCSYDSQLVVKHIRVDKIEELHYLQGSKYVQSEMGNCIYSIESDLKNNKKVLFSGTPCQCAGVIEFAISKKLNIDNLYTCDFICHGVPSPRIYRDYLKFKEDKLGKKIAMVNLRDKSAGGWRKHVDSITYSDGSTEYGRSLSSMLWSLYRGQEERDQPVPRMERTECREGCAERESWKDHPLPCIDVCDLSCSGCRCDDRQPGIDDEDPQYK